MARFLRSGTNKFLLSPDNAGSLSAQQILIIQAIDAGTYFHEGEKFVGDGTTTAFTLSSTPNPASSVICEVDGFRQSVKDYTVAAAIVTFQQAPSANSIILFDYRVTP